MTLKTEDDYSSYRCGRCKGNILYVKVEGRPDVCPECGYGHGVRSVNDVPNEVKLNLNGLNETDSGSRGITEETTITSR
jgi:DNA-directed RNA polymerase subunit RPC12/RpoP